MNKKIMAVVMLIILLMLGIFCTYEQHDVETLVECDDIYLDVCLDSESKFYMCNVEKKICSGEEFVITEYIKDNSINCLNSCDRNCVRFS